jgi:NAD-dependent deacetylase
MSILLIKELIENAENIVAFTGAGISTESGIPDFRSTGGLYTNGPFKGMSPENILSKKMLQKNPALVLDFYKQRLLGLIDKSPNAAHFALAKLEESGKLKAVVTQNIDGLHAKAGSKNIYELHGNCSKFKCTFSCKRIYDANEFLKMMEITNVPKCPLCTFGVIRPCTVLFDESLDDNTYDTANKLISECDLLIAIGSSLQVMPACDLLRSRKPDSKFVIINKTETTFDSTANLIIRENCTEALSVVFQL